MTGAPPSAVLPLVLHHDYRRGDAEDLSGRGGHGVVIGGRFTTEPDGTSLRLDGRTGRVVVRPFLGLPRLRGLRVTVRICLDELPERTHLVEGFLCFAVLVHGDGSVQGGVYDGSGWMTVRSPPGQVVVGRWCEVTYLCRSWLGSSLHVDGARVGGDARAPSVLSPVSWPFGISVGGWPDDDAFMVRGRVQEVRVWIEEPGLDGDDVRDHDPDRPARA